MRAREQLLLLQESPRRPAFTWRQQRQALQLVLEDLEVVAQREGAVLGEQLVLGRQLAPHGARRLVDGRPARQSDRQDQQRRQDQGELGPEGQRGNRNASTPASKIVGTACNTPPGRHLCMQRASTRSAHGFGNRSVVRPPPARPRRQPGATAPTRTAPRFWAGSGTWSTGTAASWRASRAPKG